MLYANMIINLILLFSSIETNRSNYCKTTKRILKYYKLKSCHKSTQKAIYRKSVINIKTCMTLANERNALAFNFFADDKNRRITNCNLLECPELEKNSTNLVPDKAVDFYSAYPFEDTNNNDSYKKTCAPSIGTFILTPLKQNYTESILSCQKMGGDLADITSEFRTNFLSDFIKESIRDWYKAAYIGLDDMENEGVFKNVHDQRLRCSSFRAWAPGQPRSKHRSQDCVILDSERTWKVVNCKVMLYGVCEIYPSKPKHEIIH